MSDPYVKQTIEKEVAYIEFFHPAHNSLPGNILADSENALFDSLIFFIIYLRYLI